MKHVVMGFRREPRAEVHLEWVGAPPGFYELREELRPWPDVPLRAIGAKQAGAALHHRNGEWMLRRSLVEHLFDGVDGVTLRPMALADRKGKVLDDDFVFVDVRAWWPLDAGCAWQRPIWKRPPPSRIFRVAELPNLVMIDEALAADLEKATKGLVGKLGDGTVAPESFFGAFFPGPMAPPEPEPAAARAFWAGDRAGASKSPRYATWLARCVDGKPKADTRAASRRDPLWAVLYALLVDRPSKVVEKIAATDGTAAFLYAYHGAIDLPRSLVPILKKDGWDDATLAETKASLDEARAFVRRVTVEV